MILVDYRRGSRELLPVLTRLGYTASEVKAPGLEFGDAAFVGRGTKGTPVNIGVELKTVGDLVNSLRTNRLAGHQLPGLPTLYDHAWIVVEGVYGVDRRGRLTVASRRGTHVAMPGGMHVAEIEKRLLTFAIVAGVHIRHTHSRTETAHFIGQLHRWWTDSDLDEHRSHIAIHQPSGIVPISDFRRAVAQWPRIGIRTSLAVEKHFDGQLRRAANASVKEWAAIETPTKTGVKRLGMRVAEEIVCFLTGG